MWHNHLLNVLHNFGEAMRRICKEWTTATPLAKELAQIVLKD